MSIEYWRDNVLESAVGPLFVRSIQVLSLIFFLGLGMELLGIGMTAVEANGFISRGETTFVLLSGYPEYRQEISFNTYELVSPLLVRVSDLFLWTGYYIRSASTFIVIFLLPYVMKKAWIRRREAV